VPALYHVTSELNRASILAHGLDWDCLGAAPGIAGSNRAEAEGVFLCHDDWEAQYFVRMKQHRRPG
jgi:hypothetical protein